MTDYLVRIVTRLGTVRALVALGRDKIVDLAARQEKADVLCESCRERYKFSREDVERILSEMGEERPPGES